MKPALKVFIDEAGDPGTKDGLHYSDMRYEWLCMGALAVRSSRDAEAVDWVNDLRNAGNAKQSRVLHYARITKSRRQAVAAELASKPCRAFIVASHKSNLRTYVNNRLGSFDAQRFYNWCVRFTLERLTAWAAEWQMRNLKRVEPLEIVFEERGGHDYEHMFGYIDYLRMQRENGTTLLNGPGLDPVLLDRTHWSVAPKDKWAGLQLADVIASAFYQAANAASTTHDVDPAKALRRIVAADARGHAANVGLTLLPLKHQADIPVETRPIFEHYGYSF